MEAFNWVSSIKQNHDQESIPITETWWLIWSSEGSDIVFRYLFDIGVSRVVNQGGRHS